jgi:hypothetical protein
MSQIIADPHLRAELASLKGDTVALAQYLETEAFPSADVIKTISCFLDGDDDTWKLKFKSRNGRRPTKNPKSLWWEGQEQALSAQLFRIGERLEGLLPLDKADKNTLLELADAFNQDRNRKSRWKLVFTRPRRGNPATSLQKDLKLAIKGHDIEDAIALHGSWEKALEAISKDLPDAVDATSFRRGMTFLRRAKRNTP